ncbi:polyketide cyclase [Shewanella maritima]|uniref:Polyketide cyclase n=1 Tax=Shewanella maritima TaxID=2520507 RepID=A0A411PE37_9GAMM|nr:nuclear transport factor 2 family protein [Shewanella maritima]QBF81670.1 polyketide cyclase [Shewanella maritima]
MSAPQINAEDFEQAHWSDKDKANANAVIGFIQQLMNEHDFDSLAARYADKPYKQHNRTMADGIDGVLSTLRDFIKIAPEFSYDVKRVLVDGDYVSVHSHATLKAKHRGDDSQGLNIIDTWKVENGYLIEHWDAVQSMSLSMRMYALFTGGKVRNQNGVY